VCARVEAPVQLFFRTTTRPVEVEGAVIPAAGHLAFGAGIHVCIGQFISRLEGELVLAALARRATRLGLDGEPVPKPNNTIKSFRHLPLRVTTAGA
jgi:hypothetical protein